ncbi:EboA domain-containing protein [Spiractinospora alimapuensis]|uniref:EboA domain-containing protein n=1 Tax=Spiractinospora alimapuensis TaxID=2820884 RepID=UPI001F382963|nr:EboA domain-containing protein [Spiractinospora alimapuensis]QVQ52413.1 EboA domain-containing protein [Spiractinospora alimapuensis]
MRETDPVLRPLRHALSTSAAQWLDTALDSVRAAPSRGLAASFPAAARHCGTAPLASLPGWTVADAARLALLDAVDSPSLSQEVAEVYRYGDAGEKRSVLRCLDPLAPRLGTTALPLVHDALRGNDTTLVAAAVGDYAARHLDPPAYRHAVLKCLFTGVDLANVSGLDARADAEMTRMVGDFAIERVAAGRDVPRGAIHLIVGSPSQVDRIRAELRSTDAHRAAAARRALEVLDAKEN